MKIQIKSTNLELTPPMREYIETRVGSLKKMLAKYDKGNDLGIAIEVARTSHHHHKGDEVYYAEATLGLPDKVLRAEAKHSDIHNAVNKVRDLLKRELRKYKTVKLLRFKR